MKERKRKEQERNENATRVWGTRNTSGQHGEEEEEEEEDGKMPPFTLEQEKRESDA